MQEKFILKREKGITLIEVLLFAGLTVVLAAGFLGFQFILSQNQISAWRSYLSVESANAAVSTITKELRDARQSDSGTYPLEVANDQEIVFYSDIDYDDAVERVRYTLSGSDLIRGVIEPTGSPATYPLGNEKTKIVTDIVRNEGNPIFYYYNSEWPTDTTNNPLILAQRIADTREVKVLLKTILKPNDPDLDFILESDVRLRMLY